MKHRSWYRRQQQTAERMCHALRPGKPTEYPVKPRLEPRCPRCGMSAAACRYQAEFPDPAPFV